MYSIDYNFAVGEIAWTLDSNSTRECLVTQVTLEVDPTDVVIKTYHLHPLETEFNIILRVGDTVYDTEEKLLQYMLDNTRPPSYDNTYSILYDFTVDDVVWTKVLDNPIECTVTQITFDIDPDDNYAPITEIVYHLLPTTGDEFSVILSTDTNVYATIDQALGLTPLPTPTVTPTPSGI